MSPPFDPYYEWLGIAPKDQPPNHYRLLALEPFESNADVIDRAADRIMAFLKQQSSGKHAETSQRLLNEVAAARITLLNAQKKAAYDQALRQKLSAMPPARRPVARPLRNLTRAMHRRAIFELHRPRQSSCVHVHRRAATARDQKRQCDNQRYVACYTIRPRPLLGYIEPHILHAGDPVRKRMAEERQVHPRVVLDGPMVTAGASAIGECRANSDWRIAANSVESTHTHLLLTYTERDIDTTVKWLKD